jgi:hypothetical protein
LTINNNNNKQPMAERQTDSSTTTKSIDDDDDGGIDNALAIMFDNLYSKFCAFPPHELLATLKYWFGDTLSGDAELADLLDVICSGVSWVEAERRIGKSSAKYIARQGTTRLYNFFLSLGVGITENRMNLPNREQAKYLSVIQQRFPEVASTTRALTDAQIQHQVLLTNMHNARDELPLFYAGKSIYEEMRFLGISNSLDNVKTAPATAFSEALNKFSAAEQKKVLPIVAVAIGNELDKYDDTKQKLLDQQAIDTTTKMKTAVEQLDQISTKISSLTTPPPPPPTLPTETSTSDQPPPPPPPPPPPEELVALKKQVDDAIVTLKTAHDSAADLRDTADTTPFAQALQKVRLTHVEAAAEKSQPESTMPTPEALKRVQLKHVEPTAEDVGKPASSDTPQTLAEVLLDAMKKRRTDIQPVEELDTADDWDGSSSSRMRRNRWAPGICITCRRATNMKCPLCQATSHCKSCQQQTVHVHLPVSTESILNTTLH